MKPFFHQNSKHLGRQFGQISLGHSGYFWPIYQHPFWYCESMFSINQPLFLQKTKPSYLDPKI